MIAMHGPNGERESATPKREKELRAMGWIDGHEYFSKVNAGLEPFGLPTAEDLDKVEEEKKVAEATEEIIAVYETKKRRTRRQA